METIEQLKQQVESLQNQLKQQEKMATLGPPALYTKYVTR